MNHRNRWTALRMLRQHSAAESARSVAAAVVRRQRARDRAIAARNRLAGAEHQHLRLMGRAREPVSSAWALSFDMRAVMRSSRRLDAARARAASARREHMRAREGVDSARAGLARAAAGTRAVELRYHMWLTGRARQRERMDAERAQEVVTRYLLSRRGQ